jgi:hypothetical protein
MQQETADGARVFFSYARQDTTLRDRLEAHLSNLKYRSLITTWHDREIRAGDDKNIQISEHLNNAHIILLLISASFMASAYCYGIEMARALERHQREEASVIPILLRPVDFADTPFAAIKALPDNRKPVTEWRNRDSAFVNIALGIRLVAQKYAAGQDNTPITRGGERWFLDPEEQLWFENEQSEQAYYQDMLVVYERAIRQHSKDSDAYRGLGNALYALGLYQDALQAFVKAAALSSQPIDYVHIGMTCRQLAEYQKALAALEKALQHDPLCALAYYEMSSTLMLMGNSKRAQHIREQARQLGYEE